MEGMEVGEGTGMLSKQQFKKSAPGDAATGKKPANNNG